MNILVSILIIALSSFLWRVRGGLWKEYIPANKIWYAVAFGFYGCLALGWTVENWLICFVACYVSYQLYGWGEYIGALLTGSAVDREKDAECELIDDLLYSAKITFRGKEYKLTDYPRLFGFCGTCLTGLIITFLWGLVLNTLWLMLAGLAMGVCYWIGGKIEPFFPLGKKGWNWGEFIFGGYLGLCLAIVL